MVDFTKKRILVTGASSGIGKQSAITLSELGASVILVARREEELKNTMNLLQGDNHSYYTTDLSKIDKIEDLIKKIVEEQGALDGLLYAAGVSIDIPLAQFKPEKMQAVFDINYFGFAEIVRQISKKGRYQKGMRIVGISSVASRFGTPSLTAYAASKAAMDGAVRCMAKELSKKGICVNTIAPAMTRTQMYEDYLKVFGGDSDGHQELLERQYLGIVEPQGVANAAAFLLSSAAQFITGSSLAVDAGYMSN